MKRILALFLTLLIMLCSCATELPVEDTRVNTQVNTQALETAPPKPATFILDENYVILRADDSTDAVEAAQYIRNAVEAVSGVRLELSTDWVKKGQEVVPGAFEILVGKTNRSESVELFSSLKRCDWEYSVNEGQILICGGGSESTLEAAKAFCSDLFAYTGENLSSNNPIELESGVTRSYVHTYPITAVTLNHIPITDYVLAVPNMNAANREIAKLFNDILSENSGFQLSVKSIDDLGSDELYIELGQKRRELGAFQYAISNNNGVLKFSGDDKSLPDAITRYLSSSLAAGQGAIELSLPNDVLIGFGGQHNGIVLKKETTETIADGVEYRFRYYVDKEGKPVNAYVLIVEPGKAQVINGTPNGSTVLNSGRATTIGAAKAAEKQGYRVLAGVNADFFRIDSDYTPQGLCIKNGIVMSDNTNHPYFAVTKDGKYLIAESNTIYDNSGNLLEAVGGRYIILKNGSMHQVGYDEEFGYTRHPRTAVGYDKEGRLYLVVVDGRQPSISNGASLTDLAIILLDLGATDALNLDGGGSSSFILEDGEEFRTMNSPSDGTLRKVYNSLLLVLK